MQIDEVINQFSTISLEDMNKVSLLKRMDTKYVISIHDLENFLLSISNSHRILKINNQLTQHYKTLYYDTTDYAMYIAHHNKKAHRYKIRLREYIESQLFFLEIKNKSNKGKTNKKRLKLKQLSFKDNPKATQFIEQHAPFSAHNLQAILGNTFSRITMVDNQLTERLTIDQNLNAWEIGKEDNRINLNQIAIIELKRDEASNANTHKILRDLRIQTMGFSKYAISSSLLFSDKIKNNNFKKKQRIVEKLSKI